MNATAPAGAPAPATPAERSDTLYGRTLRAVRGQTPHLIGISLFTNLLLLVSSIYMLQVFDRVLTSGSVETLVWLTVIAVAATAVYAVLEVCRRAHLTRLGGWLEGTLAEPVLARGLSTTVANRRPAAGLGDLRDLADFLRGDQVLAFLDAPWMPVFIAVIWSLHPLLGGIALVGAVLLFLCAVVNDLLTTRGQREAAAAERAGLVASQRMIDHADAVVGLGMSAPLLARWSRRQEDARAAGLRGSDRAGLIMNLSRFLRLALQVGILGTAAWLVLGGAMTPGGMIASSILLGRALAPVERSISAWRSFRRAREAHGDLKALFADAPEPTETVSLPAPEGRLEVEEARYLTPGTREPLLRRVTFRLEPGEVCGIIGPSGAGKSCLCRLLVGAWAPTHGHVRLDGAAIAARPEEERARHIGYLPQQVEFFPGTVAQNIARMGEVDSEAVVAAARLAGVHELILRLPDGYETDVGLHGARLSGGQRQRIALARALYGDPGLIVLDEPNSNLDSQGELALFQAIRRLKEAGRTILIVAHHPTALRAADRILLLQDGASAQFGDRDEVLSKLNAGRRVVPMTAGQTASRQAGE